MGHLPAETGGGSPVSDEGAGGENHACVSKPTSAYRHGSPGKRDSRVAEEVIRFFLLQRLGIKANQPIEREGNLRVRIRSMKRADHRKIDSALGSQVILNTKDNWVFILRGGNNEIKEEVSV
jgi:hypothetical protein